MGLILAYLFHIETSGAGHTIAAACVNNLRDVWLTPRVNFLCDVSTNNNGKRSSRTISFLFLSYLLSLLL
jgi:hypothetical protein